MNTAAGTESEEAFEVYLNSQNIKWSRVPASDRKSPDYRVEDGNSVAIFEVKEFDDPAIKPTGGFSPCPSIQEKIHQARKQFRDFTQFCCSLVLWNSKSVFRSAHTVPVLSAAFGEYVSLDADGFSVDPPSYGFRGHSVLTPAQNRTVSAIVILTAYRLDRIQVETWQLLRARRQRGEKIEPADQFDLLQRLSEERDSITRYSYDNIMRVIVLENPYARMPFPPNLFVGAFDQHWRCESGRFALSFTGSELQRLDREGVPFIYL